MKSTLTREIKTTCYFFILIIGQFFFKDKSKQVRQLTQITFMKLRIDILLITRNF